MTKSKNLLERGKSFHEREQYNQAINTFKKALNLDPDNKDILIRIGLSYRLKKEYDSAIEWYEKALEIDPDDVLALNNIGYAYECKEEIEKAIKMFEKALQIEPSYELALLNLLKLFKEREEPNKAIEILKNALEVDPVNPENLIDLGLLYNEIEEFELSIREYKKAIFFEPSKIAFNNIGWTYFKKGAYENAIKSFKRSLKIDWRYDLPYSNLHKTYKYFLKNKEENCNLWVELADAFYYAKEYKYALLSCNRCLNINPRHSKAEEIKNIILEKKERNNRKLELEIVINKAIITFSRMASSVRWNDMIGYIKYKAPELEFTNSEIKFAIIDYIDKKGLNIRLNDKHLIIVQKNETRDQKLII
ncbi:MAG: tetratricopeptide repeat protein [Candidatus Lokiarchaeota archaeon]|nr:tetratricopeptide repeat protein [Candidatus Lokiarchaeota archaeon]MBD3199385.1 tetratricopeptide repeat protein [Candidatus Lokiarchaeota archaeon]